MTRGDQASVSMARNFIFQRSLYTLSCTYRIMEDAESCRVSSPEPYRDQAFFLHTYLYIQVLGDLHHLARKPVNIL